MQGNQRADTTTVDPLSTKRNRPLGIDNTVNLDALLAGEGFSGSERERSDDRVLILADGRKVNIGVLTRQVAKLLVALCSGVDQAMVGEASAAWGDDHTIHVDIRLERLPGELPNAL